MTIDEAKAILSAYRPTGDDADDPLFAEALGLARSDPGLRVWFETEQAMDRAMTDDLTAALPPAGLRDSIVQSLASTPVEAASWNWSRAGGWMAIAATVALFCSLARSIHPRPRQTVADSPLAAFAVSDAQHPKTHNNHGEDAEALNTALKKSTNRLSDPLPVDFASLRETGCRRLNVGGRDVLEVCFKRNGAGLHYYIARRADFPNLTAPGKPAITDRIEASIATWADAALIYVVVTKPDHAALEKLL